MTGQELFSAIRGEIDKLIAHYKQSASDGLSLPEVFNLFSDFVASCVRIVDLFAARSSHKILGADKKAAVLAAVGVFYDNVIAPLDIPYVPELLEKRFVDPALRSLFLRLAEGLIDTLVAMLNRATGGGGSTDGGGSTGGDGFVPY